MKLLLSLGLLIFCAPAFATNYRYVRTDGGTRYSGYYAATAAGSYALNGTTYSAAEAASK